MNNSREELREATKKNTPLYPFDVIESKINLLVKDIDVLNNHAEDFNPDFIKRITELGAKVGDHLAFYIVQEIQDFYRQAYVRFEDTLTFPKSAEVVQELRHKVVAHIKQPTTAEIAELCITIQEKYGMETIYNEWIIFKQDIYEMIKNGKLKLSS